MGGAISRGSTFGCPVTFKIKETNQGDTSVSGKFEVSTGTHDKHYFNLNASNGEVVLSSQGYKAKADCMNGIESVRTNFHDENRFGKKTAANGLFYFVLATTNRQTIGKSQMYKSEGGRNNGIDSVCRNAPEAKLEADA